MLTSEKYLFLFRKKVDLTTGQQALSTPSSINKGLNNTMKRKRAVVPKKTPNTNIPVRQNMI